MEIREIVLTSKRNTDLYCTEVVPEKPDGALAVFVHGFCAERTEGGRFISVAKKLAEQGFYSIMMDQSGCGQSEEPFDNYDLFHSISDIRTCVDHMFENYDIDEKRMAMVGYSMGGRIAAIYVNYIDPRFQTVGLWAAAINEGKEMENFLIAPDGHSYVAEAIAKGYAEYLNDFDGRILHLSNDFYRGFLDYSPVLAMKKYSGNVIVVHGTADSTVDPSVGKRCYTNLTTQKEKELVLIEGANHGFGLWDDHMEQSEILVNKTADFILRCIK